MNFDWNDEAVAELKRLFDEGLSMSQIAAALSPGGGLTRNAVIGKLHRNGMFRGVPPPKPKAPRQQRGHRAKAWKPRATPGKPVPTFEPQRCTIMQLTNETCRWPIGEGRDMLFCGSPSADLHNGRPYCQFHTLVAVPPRATTTRRPFIPMRKTG